MIGRREWRGKRGNGHRCTFDPHHVTRSVTAVWLHFSVCSTVSIAITYFSPMAALSAPPSSFDAASASRVMTTGLYSSVWSPGVSFKVGERVLIYALPDDESLGITAHGELEDSRDEHIVLRRRGDHYLIMAPPGRAYEYSHDLVRGHWRKLPTVRPGKPDEGALVAGGMLFRLGSGADAQVLKVYHRERLPLLPPEMTYRIVHYSVEAVGRNRLWVAQDRGTLVTVSTTTVGRNSVQYRTPRRHIWHCIFESGDEALQAPHCQIRRNAKGYAIRLAAGATACRIHMRGRYFKMETNTVFLVEPFDLRRTVKPSKKWTAFRSASLVQLTESTGIVIVPCGAPVNPAEWVGMSRRRTQMCAPRWEVHCTGEGMPLNSISVASVSQQSASNFPTSWKGSPRSCCAARRSAWILSSTSMRATQVRTRPRHAGSSMSEVRSPEDAMTSYRRAASVFAQSFSTSALRRSRANAIR